MELKITQEKVLQAATKCSNAKEILKTLFPEAFDSDSKIKFEPTRITIDDFPAIYLDKDYILPGKPNCFHLDSNFKWELVDEPLGYSLFFKKAYT
jgi:hypothetical protein